MALTFPTGASVPVLKPQSTPLNVLITGAARGLGFGFVQQYAEANASNIVLAGVRKANPELTAFAASHPNVHVITIDVSDEASVKASVAQVSRFVKHLDLLINNAAISPVEALDPFATSAATFNEVLITNITGIHSVTQAYLPLLRQSSNAKVANIGSVLGSNVHAAMFGKPLIAYGLSKTAVNYLTTCFKHAVPEVTFLSLHPGWVATDMGSVVGAPPTRPQDSVQACRYFIAEKSIKDSGAYIDCMTGDALPF